MTTEGMTVGLLDDEQMQEFVNGGKHWIFVMPMGHDVVDLIDVAIGAEPTYPTVISPPLAMTIVPKAKLPLGELKRVLGDLGLPRDIARGQDIFIFGEGDEPAAIALLFSRWFGPRGSR